MSLLEGSKQPGMVTDNEQDKLLAPRDEENQPTVTHLPCPFPPLGAHNRQPSSSSSSSSSSPSPPDPLPQLQVHHFSTQGVSGHGGTVLRSCVWTPAPRGGLLLNLYPCLNTARRGRKTLARGRRPPRQAWTSHVSPLGLSLITCK